MQHYLKEIEQLTSNTEKQVPKQRKAFTQRHSFSHLHFESQLKIWNFIYLNTADFKTDMFCLYFLEKHFKNRDHMLQSWPVIKPWQDKIRRWETSDQISKIYAQLLEYDPALILPTLKKWNTSKNLWHRRQSIVSCLYYASQRQHCLPFDTIINLVKPLLADNTHYVQRGVGWTLKELGKVYPTEQEEFIFDHAAALSPIAYSAGTEKWDKAKRAQVKAIRQAARIKH